MQYHFKNVVLDLLKFRLITLGDDSTATESADTSNENSESTGTSGSDMLKNV